MRTAHERARSRDYLVQIARYPSLERDEELELARRHAACGDRRAAELIIGAHLRDVVALARRYRGYGQPLPELIAAGNLGLVRALGRFDPERGLRFITYASYWVRAEILEHIRASWSAVHVGKSALQRQLFFGLRKQRAVLEARGLAGEELTRALAQHFNCSVARVRRVQVQLEQRDSPIDATWEPRCDEPSPEAELIEGQFLAHLKLELAEGLRDELCPRERWIVERRWLDDCSWVELGRELGVSRERARQLGVRARAKLERRLTRLLGRTDED